MKILKTLSKSGCSDIILALNKEPLIFGRISDLTGHSSIATVRLRELRKEGIVNRKVMQDEKRSVTYSLTEKGKKIAEALMILEDVNK